ncbi:putative mitochondrial protein [Cucumis melo var. makuwa]|uniref:Mitochondrial protein n=1 Tax=Cucumis melo var. makuwa TaxID=1194695 RepID=A0A5A7VHN2_CUCMM|nr:putative mitochondrial protein [Cucumis melo var. makuwa]TYK28002.1 putative mitochondrial protein [Cucumis melo var. makuwa]
MFQFAKFEKSKERRLAKELGYSFPIRDPWITDEISPWPFASESVLPSQCRASIQCILFYTKLYQLAFKVLQSSWLEALPGGSV